MKHNLRVAPKDIKRLQKPRPMNRSDKRLIALAARVPPVVHRLSPPDLESTSAAHVLLLRRVITGSRLSWYQRLMQRFKGR